MTDSRLPIIDELPVASLPDRYGVARSQVYNRINALGIKTAKRQNKAFVNADQIAQLDQIHQLIQRGSSLEDAAAEIRQDSPTGQSYGTTRQQTADLAQDSLVRQSYEMAGQADLLQLLSAMVKDRPGAIATQSQPILPPNPLSRFEQLQAIADNDWRPSTSELASLLGLQSLSGRQFERYGFRFTRAGRNGTQSAWKVEKV